MENNNTRTSTKNINTISDHIDLWPLFLTYNTVRARYEPYGIYPSCLGYETINGVVYKTAKIDFSTLKQQLKTYKRNKRFQELRIG